MTTWEGMQEEWCENQILIAANAIKDLGDHYDATSAILWVMQKINHIESIQSSLCDDSIMIEELPF